MNAHQVSVPQEAGQAQERQAMGAQDRMQGSTGTGNRRGIGRVAQGGWIALSILLVLTALVLAYRAGQSSSKTMATGTPSSQAAGRNPHYYVDAAAVLPPRARPAAQRNPAYYVDAASVQLGATLQSATQPNPSYYVDAASVDLGADAVSVAQRNPTYYVDAASVGLGQAARRPAQRNPNFYVDAASVDLGK